MSSITALPLDFVAVWPGGAGREVAQFANGRALAGPQGGARLVLHHGLDATARRAWEATGALCLAASEVLSLLRPEESPDFEDADDLGARYVRAVSALAVESEVLRLVAEVVPASRAGLRSLLRRGVAQVAAASLDGVRPCPMTLPQDTSPFADASWRNLSPHDQLDRAFAFLLDWRRATGLAVEARAGQVEMAHAVLEAFLDEDAVVVEAGTGVGKTIAYALPALVLAATQGRRFFLATQTRNLQQQLVGRDLPELWRCFAAAALPRPDGGGFGLRYAKLLGRSNYFCRTALRRAARQATHAEGSFALAQLLLWSLRDGAGELELLATCPGFEARALRDLAARREVCQGQACRGDVPCPVYAARDVARRADLVVVNHALLFSDARTEGSILGQADGLVLDEAHHLEGVATDHLSVRIGRQQADALVTPLSGLTPLRETGSAALTVRAERFGATVAGVRQELLDWIASVDEALPAKGAQRRHRQRYQDGDVVFAGLRADLGSLYDSIDAARRLGRDLASECMERAAADPRLLEAQSTLDLLDASCAELRSALEFLVAGGNEYWAFYLDFDTESRALREIVASPLDVAGAVQRLVAGTGRGVVYTSATLRTGGDFAYFRQRAGVSSETPSLAVPSPFDYASQCLVVQAQHLQGYRDPDFETSVADMLADIASRTGRRTLVLATSHAALRRLHTSLVARLGKAATILAQDVSGSRDRLAARFATTPGAILLGTNSFWEGVDFPGDALEVLAIVKLPFLVPDEPLVAARCERIRAHGEEPFASYVLPEAVLRFKQGFGRLIRTRSDRGVVLLCDTRLGDRAYADAFLEALPVAPEVFFDADDLVDRVVAWLENPAHGSRTVE